jgi:hypothetical protein
MVEPNICWSLEWDPCHHEELWNGIEIKFHIEKVDFRVSKKFWNFLVEYQNVLESSRGIHGEVHLP